MYKKSKIIEKQAGNMQATQNMQGTDAKNLISQTILQAAKDFGINPSVVIPQHMLRGKSSTKTYETVRGNAQTMFLPFEKMATFQTHPGWNPYGT